MPHRSGISNRESADEEARERREHPPVDTGSPAPEDASGRTGDEPLEHREGLQTAHKAGARSVSQKQAGSRYPDRSMPSSRKVAGAFGKEPGREPEARDQASTGSTRSNENDSEAREDDEKSS